MAETITVRRNSRPVITRVLYDFRNEEDPEAVVDITDYVFKLIVKPFADSTDAQAFFDLQASTVTAANGTYRFTLTPEHTCMRPGTYPAEIRWWSSAVAAGVPPLDSISIDFVVEDRVAQD